MNRPRPAADVATASFQDGAILYDARSGRLFRLNASGAVAWQALRRGAERDAIARALGREHGVAPDRARADAAAFLAALGRGGLLGRRSANRTRWRPPRPPETPPALQATYRIGGRRVAVSCHPPRVAAGFAPLAAPALAPDDGPPDLRLTLHFERGAFRLTRDGRDAGVYDTAPAARWALARELVGAGQPWLAMLHAAAAATPAGCLLLCGGSGRGKSTLLAGLVHAGAQFMADDIAPLQAQPQLIWPTPLAISVKQGSWRMVGRLFPQLGEAPVVRFGGRTMRYLWPPAHAVAEPRGLPVVAAVFPARRLGAAAKLERLDAVQSLILLGEGGSVLPAEDDGLAAFLAWWRDVPAYRLTYGRLEDAVALVGDLLDARRGADARPAA